MILLLVEDGVIWLKVLYADGRKIEANSKKYTFILVKSFKTSKEMIQKQLKQLWVYVEMMFKEED